MDDLTGRTDSLETTAHRDYTGSKLGMWFFLFTEILLFGGLFLLYAAYRYAHSEDFHTTASELSAALGAVNTILLLTSSLTVALAVSAVKQNNSRKTAILLFATIVLGAAFLANKYFEWSHHISRGFYPGAPELIARSRGTVLFYGLYYVMTGLHGLHVLAGLAIFAIILPMVRRGDIHSRDYVKLENAGLFWHLVDLIWIYLFPLFYLIT